MLLHGWRNSSGVFGVGFPSFYDITQASLVLEKDSA